MKAAADDNAVALDSPSAETVSSRSQIKLGFIVGPTAAGKSALALEVAEKLGAEIINADSRQFYRAMDIGTAKPTPEERARVPHHLIDVRNIGEPADVAQFRELAHTVIAEVARRGRPPIVVGGGGLYLKVLRSGIFEGPASSPGIRRELAEFAASNGVARLHGELSRVDPDAARRIEPRDLYRIVRALEVFRLTGTPISLLQRRHAFAENDYRAFTVGLNLPRPKLYQAIGRRFDAMMASGLVEEVRNFVSAGFSFKEPPLSTIGYKQIAAYLRGEMMLDAAVAQAKRETRRLAKRQLTWLRRDSDVHWIDPETESHRAFALLSNFFGGPPASVAEESHG